MYTFTFDNEFFIDGPEWDGCWYAFTHPAKEPFTHGYFFADSCSFSHHAKEGRNFTDNQIASIEKILRENKAKMGPEHYEIYLKKPDHYKTLGHKSAEYKSITKRLRICDHWDPRFGAAWHELTSNNPAYRRTRAFINEVIHLANNLSDETWEAWLYDDVMDTWTYDISPYTEEGETFEGYLQEVRQRIYVPMPRSEWPYKIHILYKIEGVPNLYRIVHDSDFSCYYYDYGEAVVPVSSASSEYYI